MKQSLLLQSSVIFENCNIVDCIHQTLIDLEAGYSKQEIKNLLGEAISYLDYDLDQITTTELLFLILTCLEKNPNLYHKTIRNLIKSIKSNYNHIIITTSIISYFSCKYQTAMTEDYKLFVSESFYQIFPQISKSDDQPLEVFNIQIPPQFKVDFILDIILLSKLTKQIVNDTYRYFFSHKSISQQKLNFFIDHLQKYNLFKEIPESEFIESEIYLRFSMPNLAHFITIISKQTFLKIFPKIEELIKKEESVKRCFSLALFKKCIEYDVKLTDAHQLTKVLKEEDLNEQIWKYFDKYGLIINKHLAKKIKNFPQETFVVKVVPNPTEIPMKTLIFCLMNATELKVYESVLCYENLDFQELRTVNFWNHVISVVSSSEEKCSFQLLKAFFFYFEKFITISNFNQVFDSIILDNFPLNNKGSNFLMHLFSNMREIYRKKYYSEQNMEYLIPKIMEKKGIPTCSFCKLLCFQRIEHLNNTFNPVTWFEYEFSYKVHRNVINGVRILKQTEQSMPKLIKFLQSKNNFDIIQNMDDESLSLIVSAVNFTKNEGEADIFGLTEDIILPFFAIAFNYIGMCKCNKFYIEDLILNKLQKVFQNLNYNKSSLQNSAINSILSNDTFFFNDKYFPNILATHLIDVLMSDIINGDYQADKTIFLLTIFKLSWEKESQIIQKQFTSIIQEYGTQLFEFIIDNFSDFDIEKLNGYQLNLQNFYEDEISSIIIDNIERSSERIASNTIIFIMKFCKNVPKVQLSDKSNLINITTELLENKKWDDFALFARFMKINNLSDDLIPSDIKAQIFEINSLIYSILSDPNPEKNNEQFHSLYKLLMNEETISIEYFTIILEKETVDFKIPKFLFLPLNNYFKEFPKYFTKAVIRSYALSVEKNEFVRRIVVEKLTYPEKITSVIMNLFTIDSFQSLIVLKNIASSFPFLFSETPQKLFDIVLLNLNFLSLIYDYNESNENDILNNIKKSISALSFLFSCLYSTKIIQAFVPWVFGNLLSFNDSQVFGLVIILISLFETKIINMIVFSLSIKYNFLEKIKKLLERNVQGQAFQEHYKDSIYYLINLYYNLFDDIYDTSALAKIYQENRQNNLIFLKTPIYIDQLQHVNNPFDVVFNNFLTILPNKLQQLKIPFPDGKLWTSIIEFTDKIFQIQPFYIYNNQLLLPIIQSFNFFQFFISKISEHILCTKNSSKTSIFIPHTLSVKMLRYIVSKPLWIANWFLNFKTFNPLPEHLKEVIEYSKALNKIRRNEKHEADHENIAIDFDLEDFKFEQFCQEELFRLIVKEAATSSSLNQRLCQLIQTITKNGVALLSFLEFINQYIMNDSEESSETIENLMNVVTSMSENDAFRSNFFDLCGNKIIEVVLSPKNRNNISLLLKISKKICSYNCNIPNRVTHLIGFMLFSKSSIILQTSLNLYLKLGKERTKNLQKIIKYAFNRELNAESPSYTNIKYLLEVEPSFAKGNTPKILDFLDLCIQKFNENPTSSHLDFICSLFNSLSPKRDNKQSVIINGSDNIDFSLTLTPSFIKSRSKSNQKDSALNPAPEVLINSSPQFWKLYDKHRKFFNNLIEKDKSIIDRFKFLKEYYELISFRLRESYFRQKTKNMINKRSETKFKVSRSDILVGSFNQLHTLSPDEFLRKFSVTFLGEPGIDAGGLTNEWFSLVVNELFNVNYALFIKTNNQSYMPNKFSYLNPEHIEYFKFAGSIIARALLDGKNVNAHLSMSFLRQILRRKPKLKDIEDFDETLYKSFQYFLENDIDPLEMTFSIDVEEFGEQKTINLIENGEKVLVTNENKHEYLSLYASYHLSTSIQNQIEAFREGFDALIHPDFIKMFSPSELDLLICGIPDIDIDDMIENTEFEKPYNRKHPVIKLFFSVISKWENDDLGKFLLFLTGSSQVPINGFKDYKDKGKPIKIMPGGGPEKYPVAHTCFNSLALPEYDDEYEMDNKLKEAIQVCEFGIA